jgi:hypothetical protein
MPISGQKPRSFTFTFTEEEYEDLSRLAKDEGRSMANYLRRLIKRDKAHKERPRTRWVPGVLVPPPVTHLGRLDDDDPPEGKSDA